MENRYTIQQISTITGLTVHTLRYYEKIGLLDAIARDEHGYRLYEQADLAWLAFLLRLRATGMPIREMKRFSDLRSQGKATVSARRAMLEAHQAQIVLQIDMLQQNLRSIEEKITHYRILEEEDQ
ncbi:MerR family transcriptional regulator [Brevibacillus fulvus]|uniref:DNA-binding transcriptional MerR regulator n=1 Tax=Brevibacillus fulvus TaxID=1125967 RepID=A0A939BNT6_9BACL|nr:MerR family transcriptional regulator [Brevibacillus fulvus]MBM7589620.1 DNA-binding transcriptional MerR regulator [Brevibacillus fulvus]